MKKLIIFLLLLSVGVHGQIIDLSDYAKKSELEKVNQRIEALEKGGVVAPIDTLKPCDRDPSIGNIYNVTSTSATVQFDANKVFGLTLSLTDVSKSTKVFAPENNTLFYAFPKLSHGEYEITILPTTCKLKGKASVKKFTVPKETGDAGEVIPPIEENGEIPKFSVTPKTLLKINNVNGVYTNPLSPGEYIGADGARYFETGPYKYRVLYWLTELPLVGSAGKIIDFGNQRFPNGITPSIRKEYALVSWNGSITHENFKSLGWETWLHGENPNAKAEYIYRTSVANLTTNGGYDLKTGAGFTREQNPSWLDASKLVPQFIYNPTKIRPDRPVAIQCFPLLDSPYETAKALYQGGITHVNWQNLHDPYRPQYAIYEDGKGQIAGLPDYPLIPAFNQSSIEFLISNPGKEPIFPLDSLRPTKGWVTEAEARKTARDQYLDNGIVLTDEFSEGSDPQTGARVNPYYDELGIMVRERGLTGVQILGDYGYRSKNMNFSNSSIGRKPKDPYYLNLLGPDGVSKLEVKNASGYTSVLHEYVPQSNFRGTVVGDYYAITFMNPDRLPSRFYESQLFNGMFPNQPKQFFSATLMQSNNHDADTPRKNDGTIKHDGKVNEGQYPEVPAELMKFSGFTSLLVYNSAYLWDAYGKLPAKDLNKWYDSSIMTDSWILGTRWYSKLIPYLNSANRDIIATDYTANGLKFASSTTERHISSPGHTYYYNSYFNDVVNEKRGFLMHIPSSKKVFVYMNSYLLPTEIEHVVAHIGEKDYDLGEVAGSTLTIFYEK